MTITIGCTSPLTGEPTPRPTYTPYPTIISTQTPTPRPTYTAYPTIISTQTPTLHPAYTPYPTQQTTDQAKIPEDRKFFFEVGPEERFQRPASAALTRGKKLFKEGKYEAAVIAFKEAQQHHGKPSAILESLIGTSYSALELHDLAIQHRSNSIAIKDGAEQRTNRAISYLAIGECQPAVADAQIALTMEPESAQGIHTDVEANYILATCYHQAEGNHQLALQHMEASIAIATEHQYPQAKLTYLTESRDAIQTALDVEFPSQYFSEPAKPRSTEEMNFSTTANIGPQ